MTAPSDIIEERADFSYVRYANCWEDTEILCQALEPCEGKRFVSIASAGDNSLALLATGAEVIAADLNPAQLACVEIRCKAIATMERDACLKFLGIHSSEDRLDQYHLLRRDLSERATTFWDTQTEAIQNGLIHAGKFERYFHLFKKSLGFIHSRRTITELMQEKSLEEQQSFYASTWSNRRWNWLFQIFFSRFVMGRLGRDPEFFKYVDGPVSEEILKRTKYALTELPTHNNPYLDYILTGNFSQTIPDYLQPEAYAGIQKNYDNLHLFQGPIQDAVTAFSGDGFDGYNLSDIFEYLNPEICQDVYGILLQHARPGARFAYWNMLVPRECPVCYKDRVTEMTEFAHRLFKQDRAFFYSRFVVEEVR